ncbi:MAG TPA: hypothetical protein VHF26_16360, partial [Trebonia sp.]|nr:hypothetical protein [Trebonia sp.]
MGIRLTARQLLVGYVVAAVALSALCYAGGHGERLALSALAELAGACAAVAGVVLHRPARRAPWLLLAGAMLASALGSLVGWIQVQVGGSPLPFPSWADVVYVLEYPLFVAALAQFARARSPERTRRGLSDTSVLGLGLALLCVFFVISPAVMDADFSWPQRLVSAYYPVGDFLILITLSRLLIPGSWRGLSLALLSLGTVAVAASDVTYDFIENAGHLGQSPVLTMGWVAGYLAIGTAALPASMTELTRPSARAADSTLVGLVLLVTTAMVPPVVLFVHGLTAHDPVEGVVAVACAVLYLLMLSRLWDGATSLRRSLVRERTLRMATSAFAAAGSVEQVAAAVRDAASVLVPGYPADRAAIVAVREGDDLRRVNPAGAPPRQFPLEPAVSWMP